MGFMPTTLVFCGGGTRCLVFCELLVLLENGGHLSKVNDYWGTSAGALIATLYALCHSATHVKSVLWDLDFSKLRNVDVSVMLNIMNTWAMDDGHAMLTGIKQVMESVSHGSSELRMRDRHGLHIVVADITTRETVVISATNYPDLPIAEAVRASMSLPIFLKPCLSPEGHYWVDGGVRANFPWHLLSESDRKSALGFRFSPPIFQSPRNLSEYIISMIHFDESRKSHDYGKNVIIVPTPPFPAWFLRLRAEDYELLQKLAHLSYENWVKDFSKHEDGSAAAEGTARSVSVLKHADGLIRPQEMSGSPPPSAPPCIPQSSSPAHHTVESSGIPQASQAPCQDSSPLLSPPPQPISRRWSL